MTKAPTPTEMSETEDKFVVFITMVEIFILSSTCMYVCRTLHELLQNLCPCVCGGGGGGLQA